MVAPGMSSTPGPAPLTWQAIRVRSAERTVNVVGSMLANVTASHNHGHLLVRLGVVRGQHVAAEVAVRAAQDGVRVVGAVLHVVVLDQQVLTLEAVVVAGAR